MLQLPLALRASVNMPYPLLIISALLLAACTPTVKVATDEPITINLNINIKHEIVVKVDKELDGLFDKDSDLF
jgi:hypothetical protein